MANAVGLGKTFENLAQDSMLTYYAELFMVLEQY